MRPSTTSTTNFIRQAPGVTLDRQSVAAGAIIGYRGDGRPIRLIGGGSTPTVEAGQGGQQGSQSTTGQQQGSEGAQGQQANNSGDQQEGQQGGDRPVTQEDVDRLQGALDRERTNSRQNAAAARELAALKRSQQSDQERAVTDAVDAAKKEVRAEGAVQLAKYAVTAAAAGKFARPSDAAAILSAELSSFIGEDGKVDEAAITKAVDQALKDRPYMGTQPVVPDFDGGQRQGQAAGGGDMNRIIRRGAGRQ